MSRKAFYVVCAMFAAFFLWSIASDLLALNRTSRELDRLTKWVAAESIDVVQVGARSFPDSVMHYVPGRFITTPYVYLRVVTTLRSDDTTATVGLPVGSSVVAIRRADGQYDTVDASRGWSK